MTDHIKLNLHHTSNDVPLRNGFLIVDKREDETLWVANDEDRVWSQVYAKVTEVVVVVPVDPIVVVPVDPIVVVPVDPIVVVPVDPIVVVPVDPIVVVPVEPTPVDPPISPVEPLPVDPPPLPVVTGVATLAALTTALASATGGEVIFVAPGNYGTLDIRRKFASPVTITSADPARPPVFSDLAMTGAQNVICKNLKFKYTYVTTANNAFRVFVLKDSNDLTFLNCEFEGDINPTNGLPASDGFCPQGCKRMLVQGCKFHRFRSGIHVEQQCDGIKFIGNDIHGMRSDGIIVVSSTNILIEDNYVHDFDGAGLADHRDCIQFWTQGALTASSNIIIRRNRLHIGNGIYSQCIFMRNEAVDSGLKGREFFYKNILIEDNNIQNCQTHGITVGETDGLVIRRNSVAYVDNTHPGTILHLNRWGKTSGQIVPKINLNSVSENVVVQDNIFSGAPWFTASRIT